MNADIFGALKWAVARGQSLQEAMISLFNAGYSKQEIEEAARALQSGQIPQQPQPATPASQYSQPVTSAVIQKTQQKVSDYSSNQPNKKKFFVISLIVILIILLGLLIVTFLFKEQIADILGGMG